MSTNERQAALRADVEYLLALIDEHGDGRGEYSLRAQHMMAEIEARLAAHPPAVGVDEAMVERAEAARMKFWETDSNYPETEAEFDADPEKYDRLAMRSALTAALNPEAPDA